MNSTRCSAIAERPRCSLQDALVLAKSGKLKLEDNILRILEVYLQPL